MWLANAPHMASWDKLKVNASGMVLPQSTMWNREFNADGRKRNQDRKRVYATSNRQLLYNTTTQYQCRVSLAKYWEWVHGRLS